MRKAHVHMLYSEEVFGGILDEFTFFMNQVLPIVSKSLQG